VFGAHFMAWNLALAAVPVALSLVLFRRGVTLGPVWWLLFVVWVLFLPNAPYVLTDVVHMLDALRVTPDRSDGLVILAKYAVFFLAGVGAYVFSLQRSRVFWHRVLPDRVVPFVLVGLHGVCVLAMYLGRFMRFNSWDAVVAPCAVAGSMVHVPSRMTIAVLATMFVVSGAAALALKELARVIRTRVDHLL
jgi:uncharacterized membrane protein